MATIIETIFLSQAGAILALFGLAVVAVTGLFLVVAGLDLPPRENGGEEET